MAAKKSRQTDERKKRGGFRWALALFATLLALVLLPLGLIAYVLVSAAPRTYATPAQAPVAPVAIVFGAGITPAGNLTPMLADRVGTAIQLYQSRRVKQLLMTGDGSRPSHDEVSAMERYALARGVPKSAILKDPAGFDTYDSCYRARTVWGVKQATLVTQNYHLPRALFTCRGLGIDAVGVGARDWGVYPTQVMTAYSIREAAAILNAVFEVQVIRAPSVYLRDRFHE